MDLKSRSKVKTDFSMSGMTDIIFLLLIFFMLTSSFVTHSSLPIDFPSSKKSTSVIPKVGITVTKDLEYYINDKKIEFENLESELKAALETSKEPVVILNIDKSVAVEYLVKVASIANVLGAKISIATKTSKK